MKTSADRILTTHVGSMPRPESVKALLRARLAGQPVNDAELSARVQEAVAEAVRGQARVGIDVVSDGEMSKTSLLAYTDERLTGFVTVKTDDPGVPSSNAGGLWARRIDTRREWRAFREYYEEYLPRAMPPSTRPTVCQGPIAYKGQALLRRDLDTFKDALRGAPVEDAFVPAIAPAMVGRGQNQFYKTEEEYVFAIAEALKTEYRAIVDSGFILQIDDPGLGETWDMMIPAPPRHAYEWRVWEDVKLPDGKLLIPGVIAHTTAVVEHPETVTERITNFARLVGRERVIAGVDCGFAQGALYQRQHPSVMWAKF